jgi:predicted transcriptional regulator of viral defense system
MAINTNSKRFNELVGILQECKFPVINQIEYERLVTNIRSIYGFRSKQKSDILDLLISLGLLRREETTDNDGIRYALYFLPNRKTDIFDIASTRSRSAYFSHYSALFINNLTLQIPKQIYISSERLSPSGRDSYSLIQANIDRVFKKKPRITNNKRFYRDNAINFLQSQGYAHLGVKKYRSIYQVTDVERTLIDVSVRPFYSGGVTEVLEAFSNAKESIDVKKLFRYYKKMNFIYPYHQVIGFYLEKAGYSSEDQDLFYEIGKKNSFYLTYDMPRVMYSEKWQLYYPKGL